MKILIGFVLAILVLMSIASAETVNVGNYSVSFEYSKPHQNIIDNNSSSMLIKTFDGKFTINMNPETILSLWDILKDKDCTQYIIVDNQNSKLLTSGDLFDLVNPSFAVAGNMPFFDLADFLKTLKIEKRKSTKSVVLAPGAGVSMTPWAKYLQDPAVA